MEPVHGAAGVAGRPLVGFGSLLCVSGVIALVGTTLIHSADSLHVLHEKRERECARTHARASERELLIQEKIMPIRSMHRRTLKMGSSSSIAKEHSISGRAQDHQFYSHAKNRRHSHGTQKPRTHSAAPPGAQLSTIAPTHARQERAPRHHPYRGQNT